MAKKPLAFWQCGTRVQAASKSLLARKWDSVAVAFKVPLTFWLWLTLPVFRSKASLTTHEPHHTPPLPCFLSFFPLCGILQASYHKSCLTHSLQDTLMSKSCRSCPRYWWLLLLVAGNASCLYCKKLHDVPVGGQLSPTPSTEGHAKQKSLLCSKGRTQWVRCTT